MALHSISETPSHDEYRAKKRQKTNSSFSEVASLKQARHHSFSLWSHSEIFCSRMIEAGFFSCNVNDQVICIYCDLICHEWNVEIDDPCEVHKTLSPDCLFAKSIISHCDNNLSSISILPSHNDYIDPQKRYATFSMCPDGKFQSAEKLAYAGFFYTDGKISCFYCNGSFSEWKSNNHPIAEHVRWFPHCNYAKELCGEELYHKTQQSMRYLSSSWNPETVESTHNRHRLTPLDENTLSHIVAARLDLPFSKRLLENGTFKFSTMKKCWEYQLQFKRDDFLNDCDLFIACMIHDKLIKLIDEGKREIVVPSRELQRNGRQSSWSRSLSRPNESSIGIPVSFENDLQEYEKTRKISGNQFKEDKQITKERERSLVKWLSVQPSRQDIIKGGWIIHDDYSKCPHCHMIYYNWKLNDDPFLIHKYLSPLCLFILSSNPFHPNEIPIRKVHEQFTDEDIKNVKTRPYNGLVPSNHSSMCSISDRLMSFNGCPDGCPDNASELAKAGLCYINYGKFIHCFYCKRIFSVKNLSSQFGEYLKSHRRFGRCYYTEQLNDCDPEGFIQEVGSNKCVVCRTNDKRLCALSCRHVCLCEECGKINQICPKCRKDVEAYVIVYPA